MSLAFPAPWRYVLWGIALAWEYSLPTRFRRFHSEIPVSTSHVPERFALFTIIVLGETIVTVALGTDRSDWAIAAAFAGALGFLVSALLWWIYFGTGAGMTMLPTVRAILLFTHAHIPVLAALTAVSAGVALAIQQASDEHFVAGARWALCGGAAVYLACLTVAQRALVRGVSRPKVIARGLTIAILVLLAAGAKLPPAAFVGVTAALLLALVFFEMCIYQQRRAARQPV